MSDYNDYERLKMAHENCLEAIRTKDARIADLTAEVARYKADAEYMRWVVDNAEVVTTGQGMRAVLVLNVFGNNNWSLRDYLSMEINGTMHDIARNALKDGV